jgi:chromosomal replication initiation ATPase DnaA
MGAAVALLDDGPSVMEAMRDRAKAAFAVHLVALATEAEPAEILRATRARSRAARSRWMAMYLMHTGLQVPAARVAAAFGRDRTTVSQAINRVEDWRSDPEFDAVMTELDACASAAPGGGSGGPLAAPERLDEAEFRL